MSAGVYVNLQSGYANFNSSFGDSSYGYDYYNQSWEGFQGFIGTVGDDTIYGTGMYSNTTYHDDANPLFTMNIADQDGISSDKGSTLSLEWVVEMKSLLAVEMTLLFLMPIVLMLHMVTQLVIRMVKDTGQTVATI